MAIIKVGVLRGGPSAERDVSLKTGEAVLAGLPENCKGEDIEISQNGDWFLNGKRELPERIFRRVDVIFNALHGVFGEDGKVQQILEHHKMPYTGSGILSSAVGMNKILARKMLEKAGLPMPRTLVFNPDVNEINSVIKKVFETMSPPWVVKPAASGSSIGISVVLEIRNLERAIAEALEFSPTVLIEEYIKGKDATCGIIENFRGKEYYALPPIEIIPLAKHGFFTYDAKYESETRELCPANFNSDIKKELEQMAILAHQTIGCRHYSRTDFIVARRPYPGRIQKTAKIYLLEINTLPGLTSKSLFPKALSAVGSSYEEFLRHLINLALRGGN